MTNRRWLLIFAGALLLCAGAALLLSPRGEQIGIYQNGELLYTLRPALITRDYELTLRYPAGESVVHVGREGVYIASADCQNGDCVRHGVLRAGGTPIVCLPERIVIRWIGGGDAPDAVSGRGA